MNFRKKRVITVVVFCHLVLVTPLLTSQLRLPAGMELTGGSSAFQLSSSEPQGGVSTIPPTEIPDAESAIPVTIKAREQEKTGDVYKLRGDVEIEFRDFTIRGDEITYDAGTGDIVAVGHLSLAGGNNDEHIEAARGEYNVRTQTGKFQDVVATTGVRVSSEKVTLTSSDPFAFSGQVVEKTGPNRYVVHHGTITSCRLPNPKWTFNASKVVVEVGGSAKIYNSSLRIRKVPILYFPVATHPADTLGRQSGFLAPTFGASSRKGTIIGESAYWAINRSMDATVGAEYFSSRGWAQHGNFRARPSQNSYLNFNYFGVLDRGFGAAKIDQGGQDINLNTEAHLPWNIRGVASVNYLSSFVFRLAFTESFAQAVNSEVRSVAFLTKSYRGVFLNAFAARYQNFQSSERGDEVKILRVPSFEVATVDQKIGAAPLYWSFGGALEGVSRREPGFRTSKLVGRFDVQPRLSLPLSLRGWTFRPEIALRNTYYTERKSSAFGNPISDALNRRALETSIEMRPPALGRIFQRPLFGRTVKHTIEPRITYHLVDGVSGFANIIRSDSRDILSDTSELEYALVQRLFLKKNDAHCPEDELATPCDNGPREVITWEVAQRYYFDPSFGGAVTPGQRSVVSATADFTGIAFLTEERRFSPLSSRLRLRATSNTDVSWQLDYDSKKGRIHASNIFVNHRLGDFFAGASHAFFHAPGDPLPAPDEFNQFRILLGYGGPGKRGLSSAASIGFDVNNRFLQYASFQNSYNWDCCGISMEYRRLALGSVRNENQFRFALTLANIGTFGNLKRQEKLF